ncbi:HAD family hydrolase [Oceanospirillum sp.]|uniref:HAD family hydrolase n=1 Tax=Oceanospirillum sp. TaxID=2021254 RepID=UPI003A906237
MNNELFIFDMDDTLIDGDSSTIWNHFLVEKGIVTDPSFLKQDDALMQLYRQGKMSMEDYLSFTLQPLENIPLSQLEQWVDECVSEKIMPRIYPQAKVLLEQLQSQQQEILVISATASLIVQPLAKAMGIHQALGIDLKEEYGRLTAQIEGTASYREGKVKRLEQWLEQLSLDRNRLKIHFYTDSINDLPLCLYADQVHLVNPCPQLTEAAQTHWHAHHWTH